VLGDLVAEHLDTAALVKLIENGPRRDLPRLVVRQESTRNRPSATS
jgi:hypothetical protein